MTSLLKGDRLMAIYEHMTHLAGKSVEDWEPGSTLHDPEGRAYRISVS